MSHHRHSMRLQGVDYAEEGAYFVTIVTHKREPLFGRVIDGEMVLSEFGEIARKEWLRTGELRQKVEINDNEFCVMPNHFHGIIWIFDNDQKIYSTESDDPSGRDTARRVPTRFGKPVANSLSTIIGAYKASVSKRINKIRSTPSASVWQDRFYDHIIRSEKDYDNIVFYIETNTVNWLKDEEFAS